jgi:hypothetical protein
MRWLSPDVKALHDEIVRLKQELADEKREHKRTFTDAADAVRDLYAHIRDLRRRLDLDPYGDDIP